MRTISLEQSLSNVSVFDFWSYLISVEKYPEYIPYVKKTIVEEEIKVGSTWYDVTRILWVPMRLKHTTLSVIPYKEMSFHVHIPLKGKMKQQYIINKEDGKITATAKAEFYLGNRFIDMFLGPILKKRLEKMMLGSLANINR